ncbi:very short patch repair endonuclease [Massilia sp. R2A-15]|uniref:very short patch repair endonuclease n=1 Tax=Massilia sp. R2A-15 TaxID=3064278 RepID=UPI002732B6B8|nr:very short patch repair endonuclease [Massilia sp. R2A-15]WLI87847.1 very short patch repair endonuclease [Massilia sp. R2A-15]
MTDVHTPERRSKNMRAVRSKNTSPELLVRKLLFARGLRFRLHVASLPGAPDIVLPKYRTVIFVHGCFWHGHDCYLFKLPQTRTDFWQSKIKANSERDLRNAETLRLAGWRVLTVWECALRGRLRQDKDELGDRLARLVRSDRESLCTEQRHIPANRVAPADMPAE